MANQKNTFIGVDLAWQSDKNHSGIAVLQGDESGAELIAYSNNISTRAEVLSTILKHTISNTVIAIDAPLIINNESGQRPCEREITKRFGGRHAGAHPSNRSLYPDAGSVALANELVANGYSHNINPTQDKQRPGKRFFEVYPHPAHVVFFDLPQIIKYKKGLVAERKQGVQRFRALLLDHLTNASPRLIPNEKLNELMQRDIDQLQGKALKQYEDILDSLLCAYIALFYWSWGEEKNEMIGDLATGYIINPTEALDKMGQNHRLSHYIQTLPDFEFIKVDTEEAAYTHMGALLVDAGLQAGIKYDTVVLPRVTSVLENYPEAKTTSAFQYVLMIHGATHVLNWQSDRKINTIVDVIQFFVSQNVETVADLRHWLLIPENVNKLKQIKGIGNKTSDYFKILAGIPVSAIDRHLYTFMERAGIQITGYDEAQKVIRETAALLSIDERTLDYSIWKYMSG